MRNQKYTTPTENMQADLKIILEQNKETHRKLDIILGYFREFSSRQPAAQHPGEDGFAMIKQ